MQSQKKSKYTIEDFGSSIKGHPQIDNINKTNEKKVCICGSTNQIMEGEICFECRTMVHQCVFPIKNRGEKFECLSCINRKLDPIHTVKKNLVQSYFKIFNIFEYVNIVNFQFELTVDDLIYPIEIRSLIPGKTNLNYPMQGSFYINEEQVPFHDLKPLMSNSNKKNRREEYIIIPKNTLKPGKNVLKFKIIKLDKQKFEFRYQSEEKGIYFFAINVIWKLTTEELVTKVFGECRIETSESVDLLKTISSEVSVTQNKICLACPYTMERIKVPVRGRYCRHFSCVCLQTLVVSHSKRFWNCPICEERVNEPYVDLWIYKMLTDNSNLKDSEVIAYENGTYQWVKNVSDEIQDLDDSESQQRQEIREIREEAKHELQTKEQKGRQVHEIVIQDLDPIQIVEENAQRSRQEIFQKIKEKVTKKTPSIARRHESDNQAEREEEERNNYDRNIIKKQRSASVKPKTFLMTDVKKIEFRKLTAETFRKIFFKNRDKENKEILISIKKEEVRKFFKDAFDS